MCSSDLKALYVGISNYNQEQTKKIAKIFKVAVRPVVIAVLSWASLSSASHNSRPLSVISVERWTWTTRSADSRGSSVPLTIVPETWRSWSEARTSGAKEHITSLIQPYLFVGPAIMILLWALAIPTIRTVIYSVKDPDGIHWIGVNEASAAGAGLTRRQIGRASCRERV